MADVAIRRHAKLACFVQQGPAKHPRSDCLAIEDSTSSSGLAVFDD